MTHITPYEMDVRINSYQTDSRSRLSLHSLFHIFQEASYRHAVDIGWGYDVLQSRNMFWALSRTVMEIERTPLWNEELILRTAPRIGEGVMVPRDLLLIDGNGEACVRCTSYWIIMDAADRKPVMPEKFFEGVTVDESCDLCSLPFRKIRGEFDPEPLYGRKVYYSSLDMNGHVNNASYIRFLSDSLGQEQLENNRLTSFQIVFQQEAYLDDRLDVYQGRDRNGDLLFKAAKGETDVVTARIGFLPEDY